LVAIPPKNYFYCQKTLYLAKNSAAGKKILRFKEFSLKNCFKNEDFLLNFSRFYDELMIRFQKFCLW